MTETNEITNDNEAGILVQSSRICTNLPDDQQIRKLYDDPMLAPKCNCLEERKIVNGPIRLKVSGFLQKNLLPCLNYYILKQLGASQAVRSIASEYGSK